VVGTLVAAEVTPGGGGLRLELGREGGQVAAERRPSFGLPDIPAGTAAGGAFFCQQCALLLDPAGCTPRTCATCHKMTDAFLSALTGVPGIQGYTEALTTPSRTQSDTPDPEMPYLYPGAKTAAGRPTW